MDELQKVFDYQGKQVRTVLKNGQPMFGLKDSCDILEIGNVTDAKNRLESDEFDLIEVADQLGKRQEMLFITESGLYSLILGSRKPEAKEFKRWITHEVIPAIRKTGSYVVQIKDSYVIDDPIKRAERWIEEQKEKQELQIQVIEMQPKVDYLEKIVANPGTMTTTQISKDYGMTAQEFNKLLHSYHIQYKRGDNWYLYEEHDDFGYTQSHTHLVENEKGVFNTVNMKWTQVGRKFLYQFLKEKNILPLCDVSTIY
jgi:prophage antirepressor-like protein